MEAGSKTALSSRTVAPAVADLRVGAAHDAGQGHRALAVPDEQVAARKQAFLAVEGGQAHAVLSQTHADAVAAQQIAVEGVQGLATTPS